MVQTLPQLKSTTNNRNEETVRAAARGISGWYANIGKNNFAEENINKATCLIWKVEPVAFPEESPLQHLALNNSYAGLFEWSASSGSFFYLTSMSIHTPVKKRGVYFITFTCFNWYPLMELTSGYDLAYNFFDVLKENGNNVLGFVIMPRVTFISYFITPIQNNHSIPSLEIESGLLDMILYTDWNKEMKLLYLIKWRKP